MKVNLFVLIIVAMIPVHLAGQQSPTLYFMGGIPQRTFINPAFQPEAKFVAAMPGIGQIQMEFGHSGFSLGDLIDFSGEEIQLNVDQVINAMPAVNQLYQNMHFQPVFFGFRLFKRNFFTFDMKTRYNVQFFYPGDLFGMLWKGNGHEDYLGKRISLDYTGVEASLTNEFSLGYALKLTDGLFLGARARLIQGIANVHTERFLAGLTTDMDDFGLTLDGDIRISATYPGFMLDSSFNVIKEASDISFLHKEGLNYLNNNRGYGFDFGISYTLAKRFQFSASVNDIGYIDWHANPVNIQTKGSFSFEGIDATKAIQGDTSSLFDPDKMLDSLIKIFNPDTTYLGYTQRMIPTANLGFGFYLTKNDVVGILAQNQIYKGIWYPKIRVSYNHRFGRILSISGSYGLERGNYKNIGVGLSLKTGPYQFYLITDNLYAFIDPLAARSAGFITGMNWVIGRPPR